MVLALRLSQHGHLYNIILACQPLDGIHAEYLLHDHGHLWLATMALWWQGAYRFKHSNAQRKKSYPDHCSDPVVDIAIWIPVKQVQHCRLALCGLLYNLGQHLHHLHGGQKNTGKLDLLVHHRQHLHPALYRTWAHPHRPAFCRLSDHRHIRLFLLAPAPL